MLKHDRFSRISFRNGAERAVECSSASAARRVSPTSLNWPNAMSTVARNVSAMSRRKLTANSISIPRRVNSKSSIGNRQKGSDSQAFSEFQLEPIHLASVGLVIIAAKVQQSVQDQLPDLAGEAQSVSLCLRRRALR